MYIYIYIRYMYLINMQCLINVKTVTVPCLSETVQLLVLSANSLLHVYSAQSFSFKIKNTIRILYL